jgi:hypothetical protein
MPSIWTQLSSACFAVVCLAVTGASAAEQPTCAARDIEIITLIEDHGAADDLAPEKLAKAGLAQVDARLACSADRKAEGLAIYDDIIRSLGPKLSRTTQ